jgi:hypothetical protein
MDLREIGWDGVDWIDIYYYYYYLFTSIVFAPVAVVLP